MPPTNYDFDFEAGVPAELVAVRCTLSTASGELKPAGGGLTERGHGAYLGVGTDQQSAWIDVDPDGGGDALMIRADTTLDNGWRVRLEHDQRTTVTRRTEWLWILTLSGDASRAPGRDPFDSHWGYTLQRWGSRTDQPRVSSDGAVWDEHRHGGLGAHYHRVRSARRTSQTRTVEQSTTTGRWRVRVERVADGVPTLVASAGPFTDNRVRGLFASANGRGTLRLGWRDAQGTGRVVWSAGSAAFGRGNVGVGIARAGPSEFTGSGIDRFVHAHLSVPPTAPIILAPVDGSTVDADDPDRPLLLSWQPTSDDPDEGHDGWAARIAVDGAAYQYVDATTDPAAPTLSPTEVLNVGTVGTVDVGVLTEIDLTGVVANGVDVQASVKTWSADGLEGVYATDVAFATSGAPTVAWVYPDDGDAVTDTTSPTLAVVVDDPDGDGHGDTRFRLWPREIVDDDPTFDPDVTEPDVDSGWLGPVTVWQTPRLGNPSTHTAMVQVVTVDGLRSGWARRDFDVVLAGPGIPAIEAAYDQALHRAVVAARTTDNRLDHADAALEDDVGQWTADNATVEHVTDLAIDQLGALQATAVADGDVVLRLTGIPVAYPETIAAGVWLLDRGARIVDARVRAVVRDDEGQVLTTLVGPTFDQPDDPGPPDAPAPVYRVCWSPSPTRTPRADLDGAVVPPAPIAVFIVDDDGGLVVDGDDIAQVEFRINGQTVRVDTTAPFDIAGGGGSATPYDVSGLVGANTFTAVVTRHDGDPQTLTGTFTVGAAQVASWLLNAGGSAVVDGALTWQPDSGYLEIAGAVQDRSGKITVTPADTEPEAVHWTERTGPAGLLRIGPLPLTPNDDPDVPHRATLYLSENYDGNDQAGRRVFDVAVDTGDGMAVIEAGVDPFARAGGLYRGYPLAVALPGDATTVTFELRQTAGSVGGPLVNAIRVDSDRLAPAHQLTVIEGDGQLRLAWRAWGADGYRVYVDGDLHTTIDSGDVRQLLLTTDAAAAALVNGQPYTLDVEAVGTVAARDAARTSIVATPTAAPVVTTERLGLHVTTGELAIWRARVAASGPWVVRGSESSNSPGDYDDWIAPNAVAFRADPDRTYFAGPKGTGPIRSGNKDTYTLPGNRDQPAANERLRDAMFETMLLADTLDPTVRSDRLEQGWDILSRQMRSPLLDATNTSRWDPNVVGGSWNAPYRLGAWIIRNVVAFDYIRIADPSFLSTGDIREFVEWACAFGPWFMAWIDEKRNGAISSDGVPTSRALDATQAVLFHGGDRALRLNQTLDNHMRGLVATVELPTLEAQLEQTRSGVTVLSAGEIQRRLDYPRRDIRDWLAYVAVAATTGTGGGGAQAAHANFYRWEDSPYGQDGPINGYIYAMRDLGRLVAVADHLARAGELDTTYDASTTAGSSLSKGSAPAVPARGWPAEPKSIGAMLRRLFEYVDEDRGWDRYGHATDASARMRLRSRSEGAGVPNRYEIPEALSLMANVWLRDPAVAAIYTRTEPGTPAFPAPGQINHGTWWNHNGGYGIYPGTYFMFAGLEDAVWPYPGAPS